MVFLGCWNKSVYIKRANNGSEKALEQLARFSQGHAKRQRRGYNWLGKQLWGPLGAYADDGDGVRSDYIRSGSRLESRVICLPQEVRTSTSYTKGE